MLGKVDDLAPLLHPRSRLRWGLKVLQDCLAGRLPGVLEEISTLAPGVTTRVALEGDALYLLIQCYKPRHREGGRFEAHERHTDLQYVWSGRECIEACDLRAARSTTEYDGSGNAYFPMGRGPHHRLVLEAGDVAVLMPRDAHAPCLRPDGEEGQLVRKLVVKVLDAHLADRPEEVPAPAGCSRGGAATPGAPPVSAPLTPNQGVDS